VWSLVETMMEVHDRSYVEQQKFNKTIAIDTKGVGTTEANISSDVCIKEPHESARKELRAFLGKI
jgi:hypothetical protein